MEVSVDSKGNLQVSDPVQADALLSLGMDHIPIDVYDAAADALDKRGVIRPWGAPDHGLPRLNGNWVVDLSPAQQATLEEAKQAFDAGDRPKAENLLGTIFAGLPEGQRARILKHAQDIFDAFDRIEPDKEDTQKTLDEAGKEKPVNPEKDNSNPNGNLPTSPDLDKEAYRIGAMPMGDMQAHWGQLTQDLRNRLLQRFGIDPADVQAEPKVLGSLLKFHHFLRPDGSVPIGLTRAECDKLGQSSKAAIA